MTRSLLSRPLLLGALALGLAAPAAGPARAAEPGQPTTAQAQTVSSLRNVGTAMWEWYRDELKRQHLDRPKHSGDGPTTADLGTVPVISAEDLSKLLVPAYIGSIPKVDGWGNPIEFHLETKNLTAEHIMGLRSPGADGRFAGTSYTIGSFPAGDEGQDWVWFDGYFARWSEPPVRN